MCDAPKLYKIRVHWNFRDNVNEAYKLSNKRFQDIGGIPMSAELGVGLMLEASKK